MLKDFVIDLIHLFYPKLCVACARERPPGESIFCFNCLLDLPKTRYHLENGNKFEEHFYGRVPLHFGSSYFHFTHGGKVQEMLHGLKYESRPWIGRVLGQGYAQDLMDDNKWPDPDIILPVPLHPRKKRKRGYNQSMEFGKGLAIRTNCPISEKFLRRSKWTPSQTGLDRDSRIKNMRSAFQVHATSKLEGKHILLVDDVITTGATLEACALPLIKYGVSKISMLTIAIGN